MNDCLLSGGKQKNMCVFKLKRNRKQRLPEEPQYSQRHCDRWKYKHKQEREIGWHHKETFLFHFFHISHFPNSFLGQVLVTILVILMTHTSNKCAQTQVDIML